MIPELNPCCKCGRIPKLKEETGDIFYVKCECNKWSPYEALGATRKGAIEHWNDLNRPIKRTGNKRRDESNDL